MKSNPAKTVLTISVGFLIVYLSAKVRWCLQIALIIGLIGVFSDSLSKKIEFLWMKLAWLLGLIMPVIMLSVIFYLFLFPIALLSRVFGKKNPLQLRNSAVSAYTSIKKRFDKDSLDKPW